MPPNVAIQNPHRRGATRRRLPPRLRGEALSLLGRCQLRGGAFTGSRTCIFHTDAWIGADWPRDCREPRKVTSNTGRELYKGHLPKFIPDADAAAARDGAEATATGSVAVAAG